MPILDAGPMAPQGVRFARREQRLDALPHLVRNRQSGGGGKSSWTRDLGISEWIAPGHPSGVDAPGAKQAKMKFR